MKTLLTSLKARCTTTLLDGLILLFVAALIAAGGLLLWVSTLEIPDLQAFEHRRVLQSTKLYDRTGEILLYDFHQDVKRTLVPYEQISRHIINASVAIEDDTFFEHSGIRPLSIVRAALANIRGGNLLGGQGGSTITQQVVKNALLEQEKKLSRKVKEAILAIKLERMLSKEEILTHYLNESPYGGTIYGVEEASRAFFGKSAADITLAEAAYLAALPQAPTYFSPYGNNRLALEARKNLVLSQMEKNGFITADEHADARATEVSFLPQATYGIRAPHFVFYIREYLADRYGEESLAERGFRVITSLDWELQERAEEIVGRYALENAQRFNAENASLVATDPRTGEILVMVGSRNYFDPDIDGNFNIAVADRQPGSAFKPFIYARAFDEGYTPETVLFDLKTQFSTACEPSNLTSDGDCYSPTNYDNRFRGPMSIRNALAQSINIPAVKALYLVGINDAIKLARDMGITTLTQPDRYGLTLVLGGGEVKLLDMVSAYGVFANEGVRTGTTGIVRIEDAHGNTIEEHEMREERVLDRNVALQISDILSDNEARAPLFGANSPLHFPGIDVAAKTGTTNNNIDAWIIGYTPTLAAGAWAGNNTPRPMNQISGLIVSPLWREFMDFALERRDRDAFAAPRGTPEDIKPVLRGIWFDPGAMLGEPDGDLSVENAVASAHSILHFVDRNDPRGPQPRNPERDSQYVLWEYPITLWKQNLMGSRAPSQTPDLSDTLPEDIDE